MPDPPQPPFDPAGPERPRWLERLPPEERQLLAAGSFGQRIGWGTRPALLVIDVQNYMVGPPEGSTHEYPSACGSEVERALGAIGSLLAAARLARVPTVYTQNQYRRDGSDMGVYRAKRGLPDTEGWCLEGSEGAAIHPAVRPLDSDLVLVKNKPSAFLGTPLLGLLIARGIDTVFVVGGSTSNCVRATAVDAAGYNFRTMVVEDCVFDRFASAHDAALFDLQRQYADVIGLDAAIEGIAASELSVA